jgi:4-hydroxy-tetrahydrodipicolinate synthase
MKFEGAMTALVTPMDAGGAVDYPALGRLVEDQIAAGIDGLVAVGTTGESATLDIPEHIEVIKKVVEVAAGRVPVIAGAGGNATAEAIELSIASHEVGADALLHVAGYYNKPTQEGLYRHFVACAEATPLPIILYNVPGRTACDLVPETVIRLAEHDRFVAIKEATGDLRRASQLIAALGDRMTMLSGDDFTTFPVLALGGRGVISVISNAMPAEMAQMCDAALAGEWNRARELHYQMMPLAELLFVEGNPVGIKRTLELTGAIGPGLRLPLVPASESLTERLRRQLARQGLIS